MATVQITFFNNTQEQVIGANPLGSARVHSLTQLEAAIATHPKGKVIVYRNDIGSDLGSLYLAKKYLVDKTTVEVKDILLGEIGGLFYSDLAERLSLSYEELKPVLDKMLESGSLLFSRERYMLPLNT